MYFVWMSAFLEECNTIDCVWPLFVEMEAISIQDIYIPVVDCEQCASLQFVLERT